MIAEIAEFLVSLVRSFLDPEKRTFAGYILSAWLIAVVWLVWQQKTSIRLAVGGVFPLKQIVSRSARADYVMLVLNRIVFGFISSGLVSQLAVATLVFQALSHFAQAKGLFESPIWVSSVLFTLTVFSLDDLSRYLVHRMMHGSAILWRFHRVHHTSTTLTPLTIFRTHPVEGIIFSVRTAIVQGVCIGLFVFLFGGGVDLVTVLGANIFIFTFNALGANLRHSTVALYYPPKLECWLMSPAQHQLHHSDHPEHYDCNFGVFLSLWDRLFGTLRCSEPGRKLSYGVGDHKGEIEHGVSALYLTPFRDVSLLLLGKGVKASGAVRNWYRKTRPRWQLEKAE